jgi:hypothetical protein
MSGPGIPAVSPCGLQVLVMTARKVILLRYCQQIDSLKLYIIQYTGTYIKVNQKFDGH